MIAAAIPINEAERIAALERYGILDTPPEAEYDDLTLLASQICEAPISLVSLVASSRQWFKSHRGVDLEESPRAISFCAHAIHDETLFEVPDATQDERFCDNPLVIGEHHVRFYAGAPLITPDGMKLGTLCVIDNQPRELTDAQRHALKALARQVVTLLELRRSVAQLEIKNRELHDSREEFRGFMNNSPVVAFCKDAQGRMIYGNKAWEENFGFPLERVRGLTDLQWLPPGVAATIRENDLVAMNEKRAIQTIEIVPSLTNPRCEWLVFKFPIGEGADLRLGGVALDLTELRRAEKMKDEFVAVVSHELRTPLTALRGSLGLLDNQVAGTLPPHAREMVKLALKNAERLSLLINDLLDMEKIESGAMRFEMTDIDLEKILHNAIELNAAYAAPLGVRLKLEPLPPELRGARVRGDSNRLMQVLSNLLSNGAKFTRLPGGVRLRAKLVEAQNSEGRVRIEVCDEGAGVPAAFVPRLFERFAQADASTTRRKGGTGLGLAISRAIIEKHGGAIGYRAPDVAAGRAGATFYFELPAHNVASAVRQIEVSARILVVEDDADVAAFLRAILEDAGYAVEVAHSRAEALAVARAGARFAGITLDLHLPDGHGFELLEELRAISATRAVPIVVISSFYQERAQSAAPREIKHWFAKPVQPEKLLAALANCQPRARDNNGKARVLHVEDDGDICRVVAMILGDSSEVTTAATLAQARAVLQEQTFDLALLDIGLPDGNGLDLIAQLAAREPPIPALIFSAREQEAETASNVAAALIKSRTPNEALRAKVEELLAGSMVAVD